MTWIVIIVFCWCTHRFGQSINQTRFNKRQNHDNNAYTVSCGLLDSKKDVKLPQYSAPTYPPAYSSVGGYACVAPPSYQELTVGQIVTDSCENASYETISTEKNDDSQEQ